MVVLFYSNPIADADRLLFRKDCRSRITFLLCIIPELMISREFQFNLPGLKLCLLQTEDICIQAPECFHKTFSHTCSQPVHIP